MICPKHPGSADYIPPKAIQDLGVTLDKVLIKLANDLNLICDALKK